MQNKILCLECKIYVTKTIIPQPIVLEKIASEYVQRPIYTLQQHWLKNQPQPEDEQMNQFMLRLGLDEPIVIYGY